MNRQQIRQSSRRQSLWHSKQEMKWRPKVKRALDSNVDNFIRYAQENNITAAIGVIDTLIEMKPISDVLLSLYRSVGLERAIQVRRSLTDTMRKSDDFTQSILEAMSQFFFNYAITYSVLSILATQRKRIILFLLKQLKPDIPEEQLANDIATNPNFVRDTIQQSRAKKEDEADILRKLKVEASDKGVPTIVRTEVTRALNYGAYEAAKKMPFYVKKVWLSLHDMKTRRAKGKSPWDHWVPLGQTVALEEPFVVSGELIMYPGDPTASKGNIIGCRCGQEFEALKDSKGKIIMKPSLGEGITVIRPSRSNITGITTI